MVPRNLFWRSTLIGVIVEGPFATWLAITHERLHSMSMVIPAIFHFPSGLIIYVLVRPFKGIIPEKVLNILGLPALFLLQASLVAVIAYLILRKREKRANPGAGCAIVACPRVHRR